MGQQHQARVWTESITIPTYGVGAPDPNPMFLEKRVYQGSSGAVYPFPVIDKILDEKTDKTYQAVFLENPYLKIVVLPELGGRIQMALDKTNNYHFVYYNRVIKPALVGLAGPWISGGIEFNWPQHHRPSTFMPVDYLIRQNAEGSSTLWQSEIDRMYGTRSVMALTIYPDKAYLEIKVRLYNRTSEPQTFLWWANPACHVDENHQSVFPPDVHAVMDHGKRDLSSFPIATGTYYKVNYAPGTDISRYKNIPVPTSYMAYHSDFNFVASYDHGRRGGLLHVADHHVSPGKKQWTWGCGDFGQAWDRQLTDADGPYIELMCGVFTDNQPDFSWLAPYEEKSFTQYFMPYKHIGRIKNASIEGAINLEVENGQAYLGAYVTSPRKNLKLDLRSGEEGGPVLFERTFDLVPEEAFELSVNLPAGVDPNQVRLSLLAEDGREILSYRPVEITSPIPSPARAALPPEKVPTTEQLYLTALHLEQYRHATCDPEPYYREALRRDPGDIRSNNGLGLLLYRRGQFEQAEGHFRAAIRTLTQRNPNPCDGEPHFNLGLALRMQGRLDEAFDAFYKSTWNAAQRSAGFFQLAQIGSVRGDVTQAIEFADQSLIGNWHHHKARHLKAMLLKKIGRMEEAEAELAIIQSIDPTYLVVDTTSAHSRIECAMDLISSAFYDEAVRALLPDQAIGYPMLHYIAGWAQTLAGDADAAARSFETASRQSPELCFPNRLEELLALRAAVKINPNDGHAWYFLGNLLFARRNYDEAIDAWEKGVSLFPNYATPHRNLALAQYNKRHDAVRALAMLEKAFLLDKSDARVLFELDQLYKKLNRSPSERLENLDRHPDLVQQRDDLFIERCNLLNLLGRYQEVQRLLAGRKFHPWEGGEGKVTGAYVASLLGLAREHLQDRQYERAIAFIDQARTYPHNLGEGKLPGATENDLHYFAGLAHRAMNRAEESRRCFELACLGNCEPVSAMFYNDQPPHLIFYQGLALWELGKANDAEERFRKLIEYGQSHLNDNVTIDYFAVSLPEFLVFEDDLNLRNAIHCHYMMGLGFLGLGDRTKAEDEFKHVLAADESHLGAITHLKMLANL